MSFTVTGTNNTFNNIETSSFVGGDGINPLNFSTLTGIVVNSRGGIEITGGNNTISGCYSDNFLQASPAAITITGNGNAVTGNTIPNPGGGASPGVQVDGSSNTVSGNTTVLNIVVNSGDRNTVTGNRCNNIQIIAGSTNTTVVGNTTSGAAILDGGTTTFGLAVPVTGGGGGTVDLNND